MKFKNFLFASLPIIALTFTACSDNDDVAAPIVDTYNYTVPENYTFERNAASSVAFEDQNLRLKMLTEIASYIGTGKDNPLTASKLTDMYANANAQFTTPALVGVSSSINLKGKTATSMEFFNGGNSESITVQNSFQGAFDDAVAASQTGAVAAAGTAGKNGTRLYAANGLEPVQVLQKGMFGALMADQALNNFLNKTVLDAGSNRTNNTNKVLVSGKNYTEMEHLWDQAYGYIYGLDDYTVTPNTFKFLSSYINQVSAQTNTPGVAGPFDAVRNNIRNAFIKGRAAISAGDYATRNAQIKIIKENISKVLAVRGVYYLQKGKAALGTGIAAFHGLSEGYGLILSLRYTNNPATNLPYLTKAEVDAMLVKLNGGTVAQPGLWDVDHLGAKIDEISNDIAAKFGFTVAEASQG